MAMIKCPECGHEVSDNAPFCPNCGIKIANNIKACPTCGSILLANAPMCKECGRSFVDKPSEEEAGTQSIKEPTTNTSRNTTSRNTTPQPEQEGKEKKKTWLIVLIVAIVLLAAGGIYYAVSQNGDKEQMEQAYEDLKGDTNIQDYEDFLQKYPDSKYADEVKAQMQQLKNQMDEWNNISLSSSKQDFVNFMNKYPQSPFNTNCQTKIDSLDWIQAKTLNTPEAIQNYLNQHPQGKYIEDAQTLQTSLNDQTLQKEQEEVQPQESENIRNTITLFFSALGNNNKTQACSTLSPVMSYFLKKTNATKADVISWMDKIHHGAITSTTYNVNDDFVITKKPTTDGKFTYNITCSVDNSIERTDDGEKFASYMITATLNPSFKIDVMKMKKVSSK